MVQITAHRDYVSTMIIGHATHWGEPWAIADGEFNVIKTSLVVQRKLNRERPSGKGEHFLSRQARHGRSICTNHL